MWATAWVKRLTMPQMVHWSHCQLSDSPHFSESDLEGNSAELGAHKNRQLTISTWAPITFLIYNRFCLEPCLCFFKTFYWIHAHMRTHNTALVKSQGTQWSANSFKYYWKCQAVVLTRGESRSLPLFDSSGGLPVLFVSSVYWRERMFRRKKTVEGKQRLSKKTSKTRVKGGGSIIAWQYI